MRDRTNDELLALHMPEEQERDLTPEEMEQERDRLAQELSEAQSALEDIKDELIVSVRWGVHEMDHGGNCGDCGEARAAEALLQSYFGMSPEQIEAIKAEVEA